jgi:hypothetical protein
MSRDTSMRGEAQSSARARSYSYGQHGRQTRGMMGDHVLKKGAGVEVWKPSWKGTTTTLRLYPAVCPENPTVLDPWRFSAEDDDYGDWIRTYPAVRNFGDPGVTFILNDPADQGYDPQINPCWILFNAVMRAMDAGQANPQWVPYTRGGQGRGPALARPKDITLVQGAILQHNDKDFDPPRGGGASDAPCIIELSGSAVGAMLEAMNERVPEFRGDPDDFRHMYVHGDPIALDQGAFINFYQLGKDPRDRIQAGQQRRNSSFGQSRPAQGQGGGGRGGNNDEPIGFGCFLTSEYKGMPAQLSGVEDMVRRKWRPWDQIIQILDHEQQIRLLSGAFPADMLIYALEDIYRNLIPEVVWNQYHSRTVQGGGPEQSAPQQTTQPQAQTGRRGWGAPTPVEAPSVPEEAYENNGDGQGGEGYDPSQDQAPAEVPLPPPVQTPPTRTQSAPQGRPVQAGQRRGFGAPSPTNGETTIGETAPRGELPDQAPSPSQAAPARRTGFDQPRSTQSAPAQTAPAQTAPVSPPSSGNAVQDAIAQARARTEARRRGGNGGAPAAGS